MAEMLFIPITKIELAELINDSVQKSLTLIASTKPAKAADELLKIEEVSKILHVSKVTLHKWKKTGKIPFHRISNRIFFKHSEVVAALQKIEIIKTKGGAK